MSLTNATPLEVARAARLGSRQLAVLPVQARNDALTAIHDALAAGKDDILAANHRDLTAATKAAEGGQLSQSLVKRLDLGKKGKFEDMLQGILDVRGLEDPNGKVQQKLLLDDGLILERKSCPIGVLLIIFEARPEVIANIASLAIKSGNAAILKGGKESTESFKTISSLISNALAKTQVPQDCLQLVQTHDVIGELLKLDQYIDLVIPRGGNKLVVTIKNSTSIPVLGHADGLCSIYVRHDSPVDVAVKVIVDSKTSYPAACNAVETLLVDADALETTLPKVAEALLAEGVSLRCDGQSKTALTSKLDQHNAAMIQDATEEDFRTEFLDLTLAVKTIPATSNAGEALDLAIAHINEHSSHHTDAILTQSESMARRFQAGVDSSSVYWNASTRFADGQRYGFGTEVGISTNKIHSRGPVGLDGLMIYKWLIDGTGQVTKDYGSGGTRQFKHQQIPVGHEVAEGMARNAEELELLKNFRAQGPNGHS
ncbi:gamma-glutamyl phosphate reductase [Pseudovirgaria hyperparasitica]|uniref:glutamate-5-semialdehyde dehydrogenase n=1 Tax=Pseudovirgaria hyperparasitica TaxID=470096 RepID=A0A6A6VX41_9PEZI|nr:gamma-glutamyl phosphate reductase [Pseudovirgaria hyperparasitica]KAF2753811.1 gamma-glutamyl phosphate reductase [Pseudovirgaria hyperparasitica]